MDEHEHLIQLPSCGNLQCCGGGQVLQAHQLGHHSLDFVSVEAPLRIVVLKIYTYNKVIMSLLNLHIWKPTFRVPLLETLHKHGNMLEVERTEATCKTCIYSSICHAPHVY